jgi:hypothetical protein
MMQKDSLEELKVIAYQSNPDLDLDTNTHQENHQDRNNSKLTGKKYLKTQQLQACYLQVTENLHALKVEEKAISSKALSESIVKAAAAALTAPPDEKKRSG